MQIRWVVPAATVLVLTACADSARDTPFEPPAFHLTKSPCRGDDVAVQWEPGTPPDRNGNGIVCERAFKKDLYDDHDHLIKK